MATLQAVNLFNEDGLRIDNLYVAAASIYFVNNGATYLIVANAGSSSDTVTVTAQKGCNFGYLDNLTVTVPAGETMILGPFSVHRYNDVNNYAWVTHSYTTNVTTVLVTGGAPVG